MESFKKEITKLKELIENNNLFLLINHIRMDPDAFGSLGAFYLLLQKLGKKVIAINDETIPENFRFLSHSIDIQANYDLKHISENPIILSLDAASIDQLGNTYENNKAFFEKNHLIVIDHHMTNPLFGNTNIVDIRSSSSCELVYEIISALGYKHLIDEEIATLLLAGIHTDTNVFYNKNTSPKTLQIAADLLELGAKNKEIIFEFYRKKTLEKVYIWGSIMQQVKQENGITYVSIQKSMYENTTEKDQGFKGFINEILANIEGTRVALLLYEQSDGLTKVSLRSNEDSIDVAKICSMFGGGGHKLAAGFTSGKDMEETEKTILAAIKKVL